MSSSKHLASPQEALFSERPTLSWRHVCGIRSPTRKVIYFELDPKPIPYSLCTADFPGEAKGWTLFESKESLEMNLVTCLGNMSAPYQKELAGFLGKFRPAPPFRQLYKRYRVYLLPMSHMISHLIFVLCWCCFFSGGMFHYDCESSVYGIRHAGGHMFRKVPENPLINEFGAYIISKLHKFQNMKSYMVHEDTVIADYVRHHTTLHDGTVVHRFSKELLAFLETLVAFSPYYRANDPRAAGAMDNYYTDTLKDYGGISYDDLHTFLTDELTDW